MESRVIKEGVCTVCAEDNKYCLPLSVRACFCALAAREGKGQKAYNNHKLSNCGSSTSNEMAQIKVCLWVVCVRECGSAASKGTSSGSVPDLAACSNAGSSTRAF